MRAFLYGVLTAGLFLEVIFCAGCSTFRYGERAFTYIPEAVPTTVKVTKSVGLNTLTAALPAGDAKYVTHIADFNARITAKLLEDFQGSGVFDDIHGGTRPEDDISVSGTVHRFAWSYRQNPKVWIPLAGIFMSDHWFTRGIVDITLQVKDNKTGEIMDVLNESTEYEGGYGPWEMVEQLQGNEAEIELTNAFRDVAHDLKQGLAAALAPPSPVAPTDEILKYKRLLDAGALTKDEFERKKKQLLGL